MTLYDLSQVIFKNMKNHTLKGRSGIITGASRGLGRALAEELTHRGMRLALVGRNPGPLQDVASRLGAVPIVADMADKNVVHRIAGQAAAELGRIDLLVNNASILGPVPLRLLLDTDCEDIEATLQANLLGPFRLSKAVLGSMLIRGTGLIVNISSDAAVEAYPRWGAYALSKAALDHMTRVWNAELPVDGPRFIRFDPGEMDTKMHDDAIPDADRARLARPEDVARRLADLIEVELEDQS